MTPHPLIPSRPQPSTIKKYILGQDEAVNAVSNALRRCMCGMANPNKPIAALMLAGSAGVGKTELAKVRLGVVGNAIVFYCTVEYTPIYICT